MITPPTGELVTVLGMNMRTAAFQAKQGFGVVPEPPMCTWISAGRT